MKKIFTLLFLAALVCVKGWGQTASITWTPTTSSGDVPVLNGNVSGTTLNTSSSFGSQLTNTSLYNSTAGISAKTWSTGGRNQSKYILFVAAPNSGSSFSVSSISLNSFSNDGTDFFGNTATSEVDYSTDGQSFTQAGTYSLNGTGATQENISSLSIGIASGQNLYIRVYFYGVNSYNSILGIKTLTISGTTAPTPANDLCSNATILSAGTSTGTILGSTLSNSESSANSDVWYKFTVCSTNAPFFQTPTATVNVNTSNQNLGVFVFTTSCPSDVTNNIYAPFMGFENYSTSVSTGSFSVSAANTYYVRVAQYSGTSSSFNITLTTSYATIASPATFTLASGSGATIQTLCANTAISSIKYTVGNYSGTPTVSGLPTGVTGALSGNTFTISGTPTVSGTFNYTVSASGSCTSTTVTATTTGTITVVPNSIISYVSGDTTTQAPCVNNAITNIVYQTSGSTTSVTPSNLPNGVNGSYNNSTGLYTISGKPTVSGTYHYTITTSGSCTTKSFTGTITVKADAFIALTSSASTTSQTPCVNTAITNIVYQTTGSATGVSLTWDNNGIQSDVTGSYNSGTGVYTISGTPKTSGTYNYTVTTTGGSCQQQSLTGKIKVNANGTITLISATGTDAQTFCSTGTNAIANITYQRGGTATGFSLTGTLPTSVTGTDNSDGTYTIKGKPSQTGSFSYTLAATGSTCQNLSSSGTLAINQTPVATILAPASPICSSPGGQITITGTTGSSVTYTTDNSNAQTITLSLGSFGFPTSSTAGSHTYAITDVHTSTCTGTTGAENQTASITVQKTPTVQNITVPSGGAYVQTGTSTLQLSDATAGGAWSSSSGATVSGSTVGSNSIGTVTGGATAGTPTITYKLTDAGSLHCTNSATQAIRVYTPDYVTKSAIVNFSDNNWQIYRGDGTYINAPSAPSATNTAYSSIMVQNPLNMDVDFQLPSGKTFTIATGGTLTILPNKTFSSAVGSTVDFGGKSVTVKSVAPTSVSGNDVTFGTGAIGQMLGTFNGASNVTAERYIGSTAFSSGRRAWRLVTAPVTNTTINGAWQEGAVSSTSTPANPNTGYGTLITGFGQGSAANAANNGFDYWTAIAGNTTSSIRKYVPNSTGGTWASYTTIANLTINSQPAYMLFVRGDRSAWNASSTSANLNTKGITTLRATGTLNQGTQTTPVPAGNSTTYTVVGNPFASTINFEQIYTASTNIASRFYTWNSQNGSYGAYTLVTRTGTNTYTITPNYLNTGNTNNNSTTNPQYIASGEGFLVQPSSATANGSVVIGENAKVSASAAVINPYRLTPSTEAKLYVNVNLVNADSTTTLADGILARYDASYSAQIDEDDAAKQTNFNENLAIESNSTDLIVEARPDIQRKDTLQLKLWNVSLRSYQLQIKGDNFAQSVAQGLHAYLEDSYLKTREEVSLSGTIATASFTVTTDTASYNPHRFRIVFQSASSVLPVTITHIKAALQNGGVAVSWTTGNEATVKEYTVERSVDEGATFASLTAQAAKNAAGVAVASYGTFDAAPHRGDNLYRIRVEGEDGKLTYSEVAKVAVGEDGSSKRLITLYPNPVSRREGKATLVLKNVEKGEYLVSVYGGSGQTLVEKKVTVGANAGTQTETITLPSSMAQGGYELRLTSHAGNTLFLDKLIIGK